MPRLVAHVVRETGYVVAAAGVRKGAGLVTWCMWALTTILGATNRGYLNELRTQMHTEYLICVQICPMSLFTERKLVHRVLREPCTRFCRTGFFTTYSM